MAGNYVGTLAWAEATQGRLRAADRVRLLGQAVISQAAELPWQVMGRLGVRPGRLARFDLDRLRVPDSHAAKHAEEICASMRPEFLIAHSYRTFVWASIWAAHKGLRYDEEVVFVSSLLHDLGLSQAHHERDSPTCFTLVGSHAAQGCAAQAGWSQERSRGAAEAITMHMNLRLRPAEGVETYLMTCGTQLDAIGTRYWRFHPDTVGAVLARYPRHGVKQGFVELFDRQADAHTGSRARFYRALGSKRNFRAAPFQQ
jgi:hypothetical protein